MRVITGSAKGISLVAPKGRNTTRPTTDRVKEGIFSALQFDLEGARILDLFSGSGQLGIEALSRGAKSCTFVEHNKEGLACIRENLQKTELREKAKVATTDVLTFLNGTKDTFDIVFLDPPYQDDIVYEVLSALPACMAPGGRIFCESMRQRKFQKATRLTIKKEYRYGSVKVTQFVVSEE